MKTSETQSTLLPALFAAKQEFPRIAKLKSGQSGNRTFKYAPLDAINDHVDPVLWKHGLLLTHGIDGHSLITRLEHVSGEWREIVMPVNVEHANMQSYGIEITYRRRYSVQLILGIVTEEDIDIKSKERRTGKDHTGGDDKGNGIRISSAEESYKAACTVITAERQSELDEAALMATESFHAGNTSKCLSIIRSIQDNEEKIYVNWQLRSESKLRAFLKANPPIKAAA